MKRFIAMFTSFLLFLSVFSFGNSYNARAETQTSDVPVLNSITFSSDTVKRGEGLLIQADITDNSYGTTFCYGYFHNGQDVAYVGLFKMGENEWVGRVSTLDTTNSAGTRQDGTWVLTELNITDGASKTHKITSFPAGSDIQFDVSGQLEQIPASTEATIENIQISPTSAQLGDYVYFHVTITNATTNGGGHISFKNEANRQIEAQLVPIGNNVWAGSLKVNVEMDKGKYTVSELLFGYPGESMVPLTIQNQDQCVFDINKSDNNMIIDSLKITSERVLAPGQTIEIEASVTDHSSGITFINCYFYNGKDYITVRLTPGDEQKWYGSTQLEENLSSGIYKLSFCNEGAAFGDRVDESKVKDASVLILTGGSDSDIVNDPQVNVLIKDSFKATGKADPGIYLLVMTEDGEVIGIGQADSTGNFAVNFDHVTGKILFVVAMNNNADFSNLKIIPTITFSDINNVTWAKEAIETIATLGIISGVGNGKYDPNGNVTRAQFAKLVVRTLGLEGETAPLTFTDVKPSDWFYNDVALAVKYGIVTGKSKTTFAPNDQITRQDMAVMMYRALKLIDPTIKATDINGSLKGFSDQSSIAPYAREACAVMVENNIINGVGGNRFSPTTYATRAQAAVILYRFMDLFE